LKILTYRLAFPQKIIPYDITEWK